MGKRGYEADRRARKMARVYLELGVAECGKQAREAEERCYLEGTKPRIYCK